MNRNASKPAKPSKRKPKQANRRKEDSDDIERAVYDGMRDLRVKKKPGE